MVLCARCNLWLCVLALLTVEGNTIKGVSTQRLFLVVNGCYAGVRCLLFMIMEACNKHVGVWFEKHVGSSAIQKRI